MNKSLVAALLALTLCACNPSGPASTADTATASTADDMTTRVERLPSPSSAPIALQSAALPLATNSDKQTDRAIENMLGNHAAYHKAITDFQKAVASNDVSSVAAMVRYPMTVSLDGQKVVIENAGRFKQYYDKLIPPETAKSVATIKYSSTLISNRGVLLGDGQTFMDSSCNDKDCKTPDIKISSIQPQH